jgi:hypothetical protein
MRVLGSSTPEALPATLAMPIGARSVNSCFTFLF